MSSFERLSLPDVNWDDEPVVPADRDASAPLPAIQMDTRLEVAVVGIERLAQAGRPDGVTETEWLTLLRDMRAFADHWLDLALGCGWSLTELFGSMPRLGLPSWRCGVVFVLNGRAIESIDSDRIVIANRIGPPNVWYRKPPGCTAPIDRSHLRPAWEVMRGGLA